MPIRIYDLAKEVKRSNAEVVAMLEKEGFGTLSPSSNIDDITAEKIRNGVKAELKAAKDAALAAAPTVPFNVTVQGLGDQLGVGAAKILEVLVAFGITKASPTQRLSPDAATKIAKKLGILVRALRSEEETVAEREAIAKAKAEKENPTPAPKPVPVKPATPGKPASAGQRSADPADKLKDLPAPSVPFTVPTPHYNRNIPVVAVVGSKDDTAPKKSSNQAKPKLERRVVSVTDGEPVHRPPVVTIMGHVDHGKTTLLDSIRRARVAAGEAGGITQHIGAYQTERNGQKITFIDTPGHAAFSSMRARGASVTDIIVIVVAADDSIMPQTEESIRVAKEAGVPIIIAVNKCDLPTSNPERVLTDLTRYELLPEAYGGDIQTVNLSAKTGEGIDTLLDAILLVSEAVVDPKADPNGKVRGTVLEAKLDRGRGTVATVLIQNGTLKQGDVVVAGTEFGKARVLTDDNNKQIKTAGPSFPVEIVGLGGTPMAGDSIEVVKDEKEARRLAAERDVIRREEKFEVGGRQTLEQLYHTLRFGAAKELNLVIKADVQGSVQAIRESLEPLGNEEVRVRILQAAVGPISESDIQLVSSDRNANDKNCLVIGFNVGTAGSIERKAEKEHVQIRNYKIIYELIDAVKEAMLNLLPPIFEEHITGHAVIRQMFKLPGGRQIAGIYIDKGYTKRNFKVRVFRNGELTHTGDIDTLKRFKDDVREVQEGYECGLTIRDYNDIIEGDQFEFFEMRQIQREL
jgi:translation initiation factor IF-2